MNPRPENPLFAALGKAGLRFAVRHTPKGDPYAGFRWASRDIPEISFTAIAQGPVARITAHDLPISPGASAVELSSRMARVPLVRVFRDPDTGTFDLACAFDLGGATLDGPELLALLVFLGQARAVVVGEASVAPALPAYGPEKQATSAAEWLSEIGIVALPSPSGARTDFPLPGLPVRAQTTVSDAGWGWISAAGGLSSPGPLVLRADQTALVDRLQNWAPVGRFLFSASRELTAEVTTPLLGRAPAAVVRASLDILAKQLGTASVHASR